MPLFDRVSAQLFAVEQELELAKNGVTTPSAIASLEQSVQNIRHELGQLNHLYEITSQSNGTLTLDEVIKSTLELVWQKTPLSFAVVVLGEDELGPFHYQGMMGVPDQWRFLKGECAFPLSGVLSRALLNRLDPTEPDYLYIGDIEAEGRPLPNEFPWMTLSGSLLIVPLRLHKSAIGALILGRQEINAFADALLCDDFCEIAANVSKSVHGARLQHEVNKNVEQLVNVQLLTQEITRAKTFDAVIGTLTQRVPEVMGPVNVQVFIHKWEKSIGVQGASFSVSNFPESIIDVALTSFEPDVVDSLLLFGGGAEKSTDTPEVYRLLEWSMESGEAVFYDPNAINDQPEYSYYTDSGTAMIVPMIANDKAIGVIRVQALDQIMRFDESDMFVLRTIANSVWLALSHLLFLEEQSSKKLTELKVLTETIETRVTALSGHHTRVAHNVALVAEYLGLSPEQCKTIRIGAALHDIGGLQLSDKKLQEVCTPPQIMAQPQSDLAQKSSRYLAQVGVENDIVVMIAQMAQPFAQYSYQLDSSLLQLARTPSTSDSTIVRPSPVFSESDAQLNGNTGHQFDSQSDQRFSMRVASERYTTDAILDTAVDTGARIIAVVDAFDHALCIADDWGTLNHQIDYLNQHSGTLFAPHIVQTFLTLVEQELILLPR